MVEVELFLDEAFTFTRQSRTRKAPEDDGSLQRPEVLPHLETLSISE